MLPFVLYVPAAYIVSKTKSYFADKIHTSINNRTQGNKSTSAWMMKNIADPLVTISDFYFNYHLLHNIKDALIYDSISSIFKGEYTKFIEDLSEIPKHTYKRAFEFSDFGYEALFLWISSFTINSSYIDKNTIGHVENKFNFITEDILNKEPEADNYDDSIIIELYNSMSENMDRIHSTEHQYEVAVALLSIFFPKIAATKVKDIAQYMYSRVGLPDQNSIFWKAMPALSIAGYSLYQLISYVSQGSSHNNNNLMFTRNETVYISDIVYDIILGTAIDFIELLRTTTVSSLYQDLSNQISGTYNRTKTAVSDTYNFVSTLTYNVCNFHSNTVLPYTNESLKAIMSSIYHTPKHLYNASKVVKNDIQKAGGVLKKDLYNVFNNVVYGTTDYGTTDYGTTDISNTTQVSDVIKPAVEDSLLISTVGYASSYMEHSNFYTNLVKKYPVLSGIKFVGELALYSNLNKINIGNVTRNALEDTGNTLKSAYNSLESGISNVIKNFVDEGVTPSLSADELYLNQFLNNHNSPSTSIVESYDNNFGILPASYNFSSLFVDHSILPDGCRYSHNHDH